MPEMQLSWQQGFSLSRKPAKRPTRRKRHGRQPFEFVAEHPDSACRARHSPSATGLTHPRLLSTSSREPSNVVETHKSYSQNKDQSIPSHHTPKVSADELDNAIPFTNAQTFWALANVTSPLFAPVPPTIEHNSLTQRFKPILNRYNGEFCTIPLTFHLRINPFRYRTDIDPEPEFLVHAVMALAGHHVNSASALNHRHAALQLLRQSLDAFSVAETMYSVLDTIVILFSLDETQSMLGSWSSHLAGAYNLLEACGGIKALALSSRIEAQIGILTWWDAIISLLSREDCVFPYAYFDVVLSNQHKREWDFFGLCGCPTSLAKIVMQLARLSAERQSCRLVAAFDDTAVSEIEHLLESWRHTPGGTALQDEERMHHDQDAMHCSEAWRNGLLLYTFRVFRWEPGTSVPTHILSRARTVTDHVASCRDADMIAKQALFPLFLAGCELRDQSSRMQILKLCAVWDERTRYHMFRCAMPLLEEVWAAQEARGPENAWWGQVVDRQHTSDGQPLKMRLCFG